MPQSEYLFRVRMSELNRTLGEHGSHSVLQPPMISRGEVEVNIRLQNRYAVENGANNVAKDERAYYAVIIYPWGQETW